MMTARHSLMLRTFFTALCDFPRCPRPKGDTTTPGRRAKHSSLLGRGIIRVLPRLCAFGLLGTPGEDPWRTLLPRAELAATEPRRGLKAKIQLGAHRQAPESGF